MKILIADPVSKALINKLREKNYEIIDVSDDKSKLNEEIGAVDALIVRSSTQVNKDLLSKAKNLKVVARPGVGLDNVDQIGCRNLNISVINSPEASSQSVAEFTIGLIISLSRKIYLACSEMKRGKWAKSISKGIELKGKILGVVGTGAVGKLVSEFASSFGMTVIGYDIFENSSLKEISNFSYNTLPYLLENSDIISLHVPLVKETRGFINKESIGKMKDGVYIINTARGELIDEEELLSGLNSEKIAGVALDVYQNEPDIKKEIREHNLIITTPHIGASTHRAQTLNGEIIANKIIKALEIKGK